MRDVAGQALPVVEECVRRFATDDSWVAQSHVRLGERGWFMMCPIYNEPPKFPR